MNGKTGHIVQWKGTLLLLQSRHVIKKHGGSGVDDDDDDDIRRMFYKECSQYGSVLVYYVALLE
jgi:hypothetical protein